MINQIQLYINSHNSLRRVARLSLGLLISLLLLFGPRAATQERVDSSKVAQDVRALELGKPIERELKGGEVHAYQITLAVNQYLHVVVEQRGIDVVVTLFGPDDKQLVEMDSPNGTQGTEPVSVVAEFSGSYRLNIRSLDETAQPGHYEVRIDELRTATSQDKNLVAAERLSAEALLLYSQGTHESVRMAIEKSKETLPLWQAANDKRNWAQTLKMIGNLYYSLHEKQEAIEYYEQALPLWRAVNDSAGEAITLGNIGSVFNELEEKQKALHYLRQALQLWEALGDSNIQAATLNNIGLANADIGHNREAIEYCNRALMLARAVGNRTEEAHALNNLGFVYYTLGENQKAPDYYTQALLVDSLRGDKTDEAGTLNNMGMVYDNIGEYQKAMHYYNQALIRWQDLQHSQGEASTLNSIGALYLRLGETRKAMLYFNQALPLFRSVDARAGEATTLSNIAGVCWLSGEMQQAFEYLYQALALKRAVLDRDGEANTLNDIGKVYSDLGEYEKALDYYNQALTIWRAVGNRQGEAHTLINIGAVYDHLREHQLELEYYKQALSLLILVGDRSGEAVALSGIARVERDYGNLIEAANKIEAVLDIIESIRTKVASQELRTSYFASVQAYYEFYIDLLLRLHQRYPLEGYIAEALQISERARARSLLETLNEAHANIRQGVDSVLVERERILQRQLNAKAERLTKLLSGKHTEEQATVAKKEVDSLLTQYQEVQAQIRATSPHYASLTQPQPLSAKEIQEQVLDNETMLLEYALGEERSFLWAVTPTTINSFELPKRSEIDSLARHVYALSLLSG